MRPILLPGCLACWCLLPAASRAADKPAPPHVLLILVDDLSSYGAKDLETPQIDRLVRQGMRFFQFYANCPVCSPTRAALLTGRYPDAVGVPGVIRTHAEDSWGWLSQDAVLLPAVLQKAGYRTAMVGKWHLGLGEPNLPNLRGFDLFHGFLGDMMDDLTSDNGDSLPEGASNGLLAGGKQDMLEGGIRVPMCAVWPGRIKPGSQSDRVALSMDLFSTICEAAATQPGRGIDGRSILPTLLGQLQPPEDRFLYWVRLEGGRRYHGAPYYAVRHGDWKLLQNAPDEPLRLYNLKDDPHEQIDLSSQQPEEYAELKMALDRHIARVASVPYRPPSGVGPGEIRGP